MHTRTDGRTDGGLGSFALFGGSALVKSLMGIKSDRDATFFHFAVASLGGSGSPNNGPHLLAQPS